MKIAYASWTKGSSALLINVNAYAKASGVWETLVQEWRLSEPHSALSRTNGSKGIGTRTRLPPPVPAHTALPIHSPVRPSVLPASYWLAPARLANRLGGWVGGCRPPEQRRRDHPHLDASPSLLLCPGVRWAGVPR
jgi:hypothetical protein